MTKWEYAILVWRFSTCSWTLLLPDRRRQDSVGSVPENDLCETLNSLGEQGWEVAASHATKSESRWTLKRPLP